MDDSYYITLDAVDYTDTTIPLPPNSFVAQLLNPDLHTWTSTSIFAHSDTAQLSETPSFLNVSDIGNPLLQSTRLDANDTRQWSRHQLLQRRNPAPSHREKRRCSTWIKVLNGFLYTHDRLKKLSSGRQNCYWQCNLKADRDIRCTARLITTADDPFRVIKDPTRQHESTPTSLAVATVQSELKQQARYDEVTGTVVRQASRGMEHVVLANLLTILNNQHEEPSPTRKIEAQPSPRQSYQRYRHHHSRSLQGKFGSRDLVRGIGRVIRNIYFEFSRTGESGESPNKRSPN